MKLRKKRKKSRSSRGWMTPKKQEGKLEVYEVQGRKRTRLTEETVMEQELLPREDILTAIEQTYTPRDVPETQDRTVRKNA